MENEMIERVARAICRVNDGNPDQLWDVQNPRPQWILYEDDARAAIAAMREPSEDMIDHGIANLTVNNHGNQQWYRDEAKEVYQAMINAALDQNPSALPKPIATP